MDSEWESERQKKKHERVWRKRKSYGLLSTFLLHPPFLQAQTIATLCHCERAGGHCLCFSIGRLRCIPRGSSQPIGSQGGRAAVQLVPKNVSAIDLFPGWPLLSSHFPKNSLFFTLPFLWFQCFPCACFPLSRLLLFLISPHVVFTLPPHCLLLSLPALSVLQLVALKVWSAGCLVGALRACAVLPKFARLSTQAHKRLLPNKNTLILISSCSRHTPPKPKDTGLSYGNSSCEC